MKKLAAELLALREREKVLVEALTKAYELIDIFDEVGLTEEERELEKMARAALMTDDEKTEEAKRRG